MKQELFNKYLLDTSKWIKKSREQMIAARYLITIENEIFRKGNDVINSQSSDFNYHPFQAWASVGSAASLIMGLALENLIKGHQVDVGDISINKNNKVRGLSGDHNLLEMVKKTDYKLSKDEESSLKRLTFQVQSLSKYHLAKNAVKQKKFSGVVENSMVIYELVIKIAKELLSENNLSLFFDSDSSYDHIPCIPNFTDLPLK